METNHAESCDGKHLITDGEISEAFEDIISKIPKDPNEKTFRDLKEKHGELLEKTGVGKSTLLHELASKKATRRGYKEFVVWLLKTYPKLLLGVDEDGHTALYVAVNSKCEFAEWILDEDERIIAEVQKIELHQNQARAEEMEERMQGEEAIRGKETHLHIAIRKRLDLTALLIKKSCEAMFRFKDMEGNTPLHIAIIRTSSREIVNQLIEKYPDAIFERNNKKQSPYDCLRNRRPSPDTNLMLDTMKSHCLHRKTREEAIDFLYTGIESMSTFYPV